MSRIRLRVCLCFASTLGLLTIANGLCAQELAVSAEGIYRDSNGRLPQVQRESLDAAGQRVYDRLRAPGARYTNGFRGPAAMWMHSPEYADKATALGEVVRNSPVLGPKLLELAIAVVSVEVEDQVEWNAHAPLAVAAGLPEATLKVVREKGAVGNLDPKEALVIDFTRQVVSQHKLDRSTFERALAAFGPRGVTDLQAVIGHYVLCNITNATFDIRPR